MKHWLITLTAAMALALSLGALADEALDLNTASLEALTALDNIGQTRAEAIIEYREANGGFTSVEEFSQVSGVGEATLERNRDRLTVSE